MTDRPQPTGGPSWPVAFAATLVRWPGPGAWVFVRVPDDHSPDGHGAFGRVPIVATVDGRTWRTSVWWDSKHRWLLAVPARVRGGKDDGDEVEVEIDLDPSRAG
jgi:hypothetical protein